MCFIESSVMLILLHCLAINIIFNAKNYSNNTTDPTKKVNLLGVYVQLKLIVSDDIEKIVDAGYQQAKRVLSKKY